VDFITEKISLPVNEVSKTITFFTLLFKLIKIAAMMQQNGIVSRAYIRYKKLIFPAIPGGGLCIFWIETLVVTRRMLRYDKAGYTLPPSLIYIPER
jgi:hypothetical protein